MISTQDIIERLWLDHRVEIITDYEEEFSAAFTRFENYFDITLHGIEEAAGFITLKNERKGLYSIVNDTALNPHPTFVNTPGHGIEVKKKFRKRGIGAALLCLGVGIAQMDHKTQSHDEQFKVVATDVTSLGLGCYRRFGFQIQEGVTVSTGEYTNPEIVPEIDIRRWKVPFLLRFLKRIHFR